MGVIYNVPSTIKVPEYDYKNREQSLIDESKFYEELKSYLKERNTNKYVGEVAQFAVADGYAVYMVASIKPLELVHIPLYDGYEYPYISRLKSSDIIDNINSRKRLSELFKK